MTLTPLNKILDVDDLFHTTSEEINAALIETWKGRGPLYQMYAASLEWDNNPAYAKLTQWASELIGPGAGESAVILEGCQNIHSYMMVGWETGIRDEFLRLTQHGMSKENLLDIALFAKMYAGMRGLGYVFHAVGDFLPSLAPQQGTAAWPEGWDVDPEAFKSGLDLGSRDLTKEDIANLTAWYERLIGYLPKSIDFGIRHNPKFVKLNRARWELTLRTVPKQLAPYIMLRHHMVTQSVDGLREAALLAKAWGMTDELIIRALVSSAMEGTSFEGFYAACEALDDILG